MYVRRPEEVKKAGKYVLVGRKSRVGKRKPGGKKRKLGYCMG
jgi:hypothetical protein